MKRIIMSCVTLLLCISITACSGTSSNENYYNNNGTNVMQETTSNGYASKEAIVDYYVRAQTGQRVSKNEVQQSYPQEVWDNWQDYMDFSLDETYANFQKNAEQAAKEYSSKYGSDYVITYVIKDTTMEKAGIYEVTVELKIEGDLRSDTGTIYILVRKIGNKWYGY